MATAVSLIFVFSTPLAALYAVLGFLKSPSRWRRYFPFFLLTVFMISHAFELNCELDITRHYYMAEDIARYNRFKNVFLYGGDGLFVRNLFFWTAARLGDLRLIPAVSNTIVYGAAVYITCDAASREKSEKMIPRLLCFQILGLMYFTITCNVRNVCAFAIVALATYLDLVKKKRSIWIVILYILPGFLHQSAFILVLFRVLAPITKRSIIATVGLISLFPLVTNFLYEYRTFFGKVGNIVLVSITKLYKYWNNDEISEYEQGILTRVGDKLQRTFILIFALLSVALICIYIYERTKEQKSSYSLFALEIGLMTIGSTSFFIAPHYWRFYSALIIVLPSVLIPIYNKGLNNKNLYHIINLIMPCIISAIFLMDLRRFVLYTHLDIIFVRLLTENVIFVAFDILSKLFVRGI